ncbi:hypothetical protein ABID19_006354 [Mesorhizobium robiniae]|uniref:Uncharacterized protein n=1 Tax=Mesorhizobium robiniae TaxID=559315 RepID=A0ABV2GYB4_9HYPH
MMRRFVDLIVLYKWTIYTSYRNKAGPFCTMIFSKPAEATPRSHIFF